MVTVIAHSNRFTDQQDSTKIKTNPGGSFTGIISIASGFNTAMEKQQWVNTVCIKSLQPGFDSLAFMQLALQNQRMIWQVHMRSKKKTSEKQIYKLSSHCQQQEVLAWVCMCKGRYHAGVFYCPWRLYGMKQSCPHSLFLHNDLLPSVLQDTNRWLCH